MKDDDAPVMAIGLTEVAPGTITTRACAPRQKKGQS